MATSLFQVLQQSDVSASGDDPGASAEGVEDGQEKKEGEGEEEGEIDGKTTPQTPKAASKSWFSWS